MKTTELRLGNWIIDRNNGIPMRVTGIVNDSVYTDFNAENGDLWEVAEKDIEPIKVTAAILLSCGFRYSRSVHGYDQYCIYGFKYRLSNGVFRFAHFVTIPPQLIFLHQLQNWIFLLNQKELNIDLK